MINDANDADNLPDYLAGWCDGRLARTPSVGENDDGTARFTARDLVVAYSLGQEMAARRVDRGPSR